MIRFTVESGDAGRADLALLQRFPGTSRALLARFFAERRVRVDGAIAKKGTRLRVGAIVELDGAPPTHDDLRAIATPEAPLSVLYEDAELVAISKPAATPTHPLRPGELGTAANALVARYPECVGLGDDPRESGFVHRLDADTTGVLVAARTRDAWERLRAAFAEGRVAKEYLALVIGRADGPGECDEPIGNLEAYTTWTIERELGAFTLLRCAARTGRMHQIRVHLADAGYPLAGDDRYGPGREAPAGLTGHFLHAARVELPHPRTGERLAIEAPMPADREALLAELAR